MSISLNNAVVNPNATTNQTHSASIVVNGITFYPPCVINYIYEEGKMAPEHPKSVFGLTIDVAPAAQKPDDLQTMLILTENMIPTKNSSGSGSVIKLYSHLDNMISEYDMTLVSFHTPIGRKICFYNIVPGDEAATAINKNNSLEEVKDMQHKLQMNQESVRAVNDAFKLFNQARKDEKKHLVHSVKSGMIKKTFAVKAKLRDETSLVLKNLSERLAIDTGAHPARTGPFAPAARTAPAGPAARTAPAGPAGPAGPVVATASNAVVSANEQ